MKDYSILGEPRRLGVEKSTYAVRGRTRNNGIIVFAKYPEQGHVKTRLAAGIGEEHALGLYQCFLADLSETLATVDDDLIICYSPATEIASSFFKECFGGHPLNYAQRGADLGERMKNALCDGFDQGFEKLVIIGSDSPQLSVEIFDTAFFALDQNDCVLGPSTDGGYYLLGFSKSTFTDAIFANIAWSTDRVLRQTKNRLQQQSLSYSILPEYADIDDIADLKSWYSKKIKSHTTHYIHQHHLL